VPHPWKSTGWEYDEVSTSILYNLPGSSSTCMNFDFEQKFLDSEL